MTCTSPLYSLVQTFPKALYSDFSGYTFINRTIITVITFHLILTPQKCIQFNVQVANAVVIDIANDVLPIW